MDSVDTQDRIKDIAKESLDTFSKVAEAAKSQLAGASPASGSETLANPNPWSSSSADKKIQEIKKAATEGYRMLSREPAIARVAVIDESGDEITHYICRAAPPHTDDTGIKLVSYRSPRGRLAALLIGEEHTVTLPGGETISVEVLEKAKFHPIQVNQEWDSRDSTLEGGDYGPLTVESLRTLLRPDGDEIDAAWLESLLAEEKVRQGLRRSVIQKMDLRDQPILDRYQDDIFRLPLDSRLLILGAPGTGKTTTLIKRLGQKRDPAFLDEDERQSIQSNAFGGENDHGKSWIMFTPTELLKLYLKEAFNREGVPAPDSSVRTWTDFRNDLARNVFGILRAAVNRSAFVMKDAVRTLEAGTETDQTAWFSDFDEWQKTDFWNEIRDAARSLSESPTQEISELAGKILAILEKAGPKPHPGAFVSLAALGSEIQVLVKSMKEITDEKIRSTLIKQGKQFLDDMARLIEGLAETNDEPEDQDSEDDEEEDPNQPTGRPATALQHYMRAVRSRARARARGRRVRKASRTGRLLEWIGDRSLSEQELLDVGGSLVVQSALRRFVNPVRRYINGVPARYRGFRRIRQRESRWYRADGFRPADIHPLEVDIVLLTMIRAADDLITGARSLRNADNPASVVLERLQQLYRTQVLVDEATDFSPVQLACMAALARPGTRSFCACGDFNQRITSWGARSLEDMKWAVPDMDTKAISVAYRQSRQLHDLAQRIAELSENGAANAVLPKYVDNDGVAPVLAKNMIEAPAIADWLTGRIVEIEKFVRELPSVAVLVNDEDEVHKIETALRGPLEDQNIQVTPCTNGQIRGDDGSVRVVNVEHIKGLEFEAVFFVGIDKLAERRPKLFDKFLYVGATRAAAYLGMTCERELPAVMAGLEEAFAQSWQ